MITCPNCGGSGEITEVARYRQPPPEIFTIGTGQVAEVELKRMCIPCGGRGKVPSLAEEVGAA